MTTIIILSIHASLYIVLEFALVFVCGVAFSDV